MIGTVKFETRIRELVENLPDLAVLVESLSNTVTSPATRGQVEERSPSGCERN
jgi:hypothetical protein